MAGLVVSPSLGAAVGNEHGAANNTIVIGFDGSAQSRDALALAATLAEALPATLEAVKVLSFPPDLLTAEELNRAVGVDVEAILATAQEQLAPRPVRTRAVGADSAAKGLYQVAEEESAIVIVVGSTHRGPLGRVVPGDVGANLLHGAPCAVAVAPRGYADGSEQRLHRLMVGFDGSPESALALQAAVNLVERTEGTLTVITVVEPGGYGWGEALAVLSEGDLRSRGQVKKGEILERGLESIPDGVAVDGQLINGEVAEALAHASKEADLLLVGSRSYGPVRRTLLGSASSAVMKRAECPVLVLPRAGANGVSALAS